MRGGYLDVARHGDELFRESLCGADPGETCDAADGPFGGGIVGGEMFDRLIGGDNDEERVDLDDLAGPLRLEAFGQTSDVALTGVETKAPAARLAAQGGDGRDEAFVHQFF
jgi:hypothetical protein